MPKPPAGIRQRCKCSKPCSRHGWTWTAEFTDPSGARRQVSHAERTLEAARRARARFIATTRHDSVNCHVETLQDLLTTWIATLEQDGRLRRRTLVSYRGVVERYLVPQLGSVRLSRLGNHHLAALDDAIRQQHPTISPTTRRYIVVVLKSALNDAVRSGALNINPIAAAPMPKASTGPRTPWSVDQFLTFLDTCTYHRLRILFMIAGLTGLRLSEICALRWENVIFHDDGTARLEVRWQLDPAARELLQPPKTTRGTRAVALGAELAAELRSWRARQSEERLRLGEIYSAEGWVFARDDGHHLRPDVVSSTFRKLVAKTELPPVHFHDLRHLAASMMIEAGSDLSTVSQTLGHSSIRTTADVYVHQLGEASRRNASATEELFRRAREKKIPGTSLA